MRCLLDSKVGHLFPVTVPTNPPELVLINWLHWIVMQTFLSIESHRAFFSSLTADIFVFFLRKQIRSEAS